MCDAPPAEGIRLSTLPIKPGYYRHSNRSVDVRRCPDASANCDDASTCAESTSGCRGTVDGGSVCYPDLKGVFCQTCAVRDDSALLYYRPARGGARASCEVCTDTIGRTVGAMMGGLLGGALVLGLLRRLSASCLSKARRATLAAWWDTFAPQNKLKLIISGAMITTKLASVYDVDFPAQVKQLLNLFSLALAFGIEVSTPLACVGLDGYRPRLLFSMLAPPALAAAIVVATLVRLCLNTRRAISLVELRDKATPWLLRLAFLSYPVVTNTAFDAFPCHTLAEGEWLKADVAIQCGTAEHEQAIRLAWAAIVAYPIGLLVLSAALLFRARHVIHEHRPTQFSKAIRFLHAEYKPSVFWWELVGNAPCRLGGAPTRPSAHQPASLPPASAACLCHPFASR